MKTRRGKNTVFPWVKSIVHSRQSGEGTSKIQWKDSEQGNLDKYSSGWSVWKSFQKGLLAAWIWRWAWPGFPAPHPPGQTLEFWSLWFSGAQSRATVIWRVTEQWEQALPHPEPVPLPLCMFGTYFSPGFIEAQHHQKVFTLQGVAHNFIFNEGCWH